MLKRLGLLMGLTTLNAYGFGVDVCFNSPDSKSPPIRNCLSIEKNCRTSNLSTEKSTMCQLKALYDGVSGLIAKGETIAGGRSLVHADSTYFMAQLIGFSPWQAYQMMIYSEATDQAEYTAFSQQGKKLLTDTEAIQCRTNWHTDMPRKCLLLTPELNGIYKFSFKTGGMLLHLHARFSPNGKPPPVPLFPTDYFSEENASFERLLTNFRAWVFNERRDACAAGITQKMNLPDAIHAPCENTQHTLKSPISLFSVGLSRVPFVTNLGTLILNANKNNETAKLVLATNKNFQRYITPHDVNFAKMGVFVHALADRYSHHMCTDNSYFYKEENNHYTSVYSAKPCAQGSHFLWHTWEQGTNQSDTNLSTLHQTMRPALEAVYDQLLSYAKYQHITINQHLDKTNIIHQLILVLQTFDPEERLQKMVTLMEKNDVLPLPGHGHVKNMHIDEWLSLAGAPK